MATKDHLEEIFSVWPAALKELREEAGYQSLRPALSAAEDRLAGQPKLLKALPRLASLSNWERLDRATGSWRQMPGLNNIAAYLRGIGYSLADLEHRATQIVRRASE